MMFGIIVLVAQVWKVPVAWSSDLSANPLKQIQIKISSSITFNYDNSIVEKKNGKLTIEFCPDSTCEGFESTLDSSIEDLRNFSYLYIFYFSDSNYLGSWRQEEFPNRVAQRILSSPRYTDCPRKSDKDSAGCILRSLARTKGMKLYFVRYDEGARNVGPLDVMEITGGSR
jgi:hypothetical protein